MREIERFFIGSRVIFYIDLGAVADRACDPKRRYELFRITLKQRELPIKVMTVVSRNRSVGVSVR